MDQIPHGILSLNMVDHQAWLKTSSTLPTQLLQTPTLETQSHGTTYTNILSLEAHVI
jgi:hypothetical protein